ncbi:MAG: hypothetical protein HYV63_30990 [Candidatus Schekmanbacteria bacterium]|nr:hypothetical protein [Candidatus Schekmanbacteria bacterium]
MEIQMLDLEEARQLLDEGADGARPERDAIAELLRQEVFARGSCARHLASARVVSMARPARELDPEQVDEVCEELERDGDLVLAEGAILYPAPVRIVDLGDGVFRFAAGLPSRALCAAVTGDWVRQGTRRECRTTSPIADVAVSLGGIVLTPSAWAGLDRAPVADALFLGELDARLEAAPEPTGSRECGDGLDWSSCEIAADGARWRRAVAQGTASRLWRAHQPWRRWVHAWTGGESPARQTFTPLHGDEAARAVHALAVAAGTPLRAVPERRRDVVVVTFPERLPLAEHRYLAVSAQREPSARGCRWTIPAARFDAVSATLATRLGMVFEPSGKKP